MKGTRFFVPGTQIYAEVVQNYSGKSLKCGSLELMRTGKGTRLGTQRYANGVRKGTQTGYAFRVRIFFRTGYKVEYKMVRGFAYRGARIKQL